jgi:lipoprotein-anchoring transpeptidase ErfK/SrfK
LRLPLITATVAAAVVLVGGGGVVFAYDSGHRDVIAQGVTIGGVDVGGLTGAQARSRLQERLVEPLRQPVIVRHGRYRARLGAAQAHLRVDVDASVAEALRRSRNGNPLSRTVRTITGGTIAAQIKPVVTYDARAVSGLVRRVARTLDRRPRDASVRPSAYGLQRVASRPGRAVVERRLKARIVSALTTADGTRAVSVPVRRVAPKVTTGELARRYPTYLVVNRSGFVLKLYKKLKLVKTYPVAVGQVGLETPAGLYHIQNKAVNPAWSVPNSAWAGDLAGQVIPGGAPNNPIRARWLGIYDGAGIHGTTETGSLGSAASHGCIRMAVPDVVDLYPRVPLHTPIYIA